MLENEEDKVKEILSRSSALCCLTDVELRMKSRCIQLCCPDLEQDEARANFLERALGVWRRNGCFPTLHSVRFCSSI